MQSSLFCFLLHYILTFPVLRFLSFLLYPPAFVQFIRWGELECGRASVVPGICSRVVGAGLDMLRSAKWGRADPTDGAGFPVEDRLLLPTGPESFPTPHFDSANFAIEEQ